MLYLAEIKKQNKNFLSGYKTELKLLACQHSDQTWRALPSPESYLTDAMGEAKEGTLWILNLSNNRDWQGDPEIAAPELVRQLQKLSRLSAKLKDQQGEIERWRESLTFQFQELNKREMDIEAKESELEKRESVLKDIQQQQYEVEQAWHDLQEKEKQLTGLEQQFGVAFNNTPENREILHSLWQRLGSSPEVIPSLARGVSHVRQTVAQQQETFKQYWQLVTDAQQNLATQQTAIAQKQELLTLHRQDLETIHHELNQAKVQFQLEQQGIELRQQHLNHVKAEISTVETLQSSLSRLATGAMPEDNNEQVDCQKLEQLPLGELEAAVQKLQMDLQKLAHFVNDQEEELTLQCQAVDELQTQLEEADGARRLTLEKELSDGQECKQMLNETLIGQRRNLKERQSILLQHLKILRCRQGIVELDDSIPHINLDPVIQQLEVRKQQLKKERDALEQTLANTRQGLEQIEIMVQKLAQEYQTKQVAVDQEAREIDAWRQDIVVLDIKREVLQSTLPPLQNPLDDLSPRLDEIQALLFGE
ncbi:MAG: hypothetical protein RLZZ568_51 [Cyanobacteriota bacterium]